MANTKVTGDLIASSTIATGNIADNAVTSDKISGITTAHIAEGSNLYYTDARADARVALIVDSAPATLDTLNELAAALGDDPNFATTTANSIGLKAPLASPSFTGNATFAGNVTVGNNGNINIPTASSGNANLNFDGTDFKITSNSSTANLKLETNSTTRLTIDSSGNATFAGNVLIGTNINSSIGLQVNQSLGSGNAIGFFRNSASSGGNGLVVDVTNTPNNYLADFRIGNSSKVRIDSSGNVGIGTDSPGYTFTVFKSITNDWLALFGNTYNGAGNGVLIDAGNGSSGEILRLRDKDGNSKVSFLSNGNVGIGTTSPFSKLTVSRAGINEGTISFDDQTNNAHLTLAGTDALVRLQLGTYNNGNYGGWIQASYDNGGINYGTEPLILNPQGGNVGIGTTSPGAKLVLATAAGASTQLRLQRIDGAETGMIYLDTNDDLNIRNTGGSGDIILYPHPTSGKTIVNYGNVGIGTTSPNTKLDVVTSGTSENVIQLRNATQTLALGVNDSSGGAFLFTNTNHALRFGCNGSEVGRFSNTGNFGIGTATPSEKLHIKGGGSGPEIRLEGTWGSHYIRAYNDNWNFLVGGTVNAINIKNNGNVGLGTTSPQTKLDVDGGVRIRTVEYTWHRSNPITSTNSYRHYKTTLYAGSGGNTMHIMGGFTFKSYSYSSNGYGEGSCMFHNWTGILYNLSVTNRGQWSNFVRSPYISSDGYVVIVCEQDTYSQPIIDFYQFYTPYGWRNVTVSGDTTSNSLTGVY
jgi:hypothetical protein